MRPSLSLVAKLRTSKRDAADGSTAVLASLVERIRERWPEVRIIVRGDSGFRDHDQFGMERRTLELTRVAPKSIS